MYLPDREKKASRIKESAISAEGEGYWATVIQRWTSPNRCSQRSHLLFVKKQFLQVADFLPGGRVGSDAQHFLLVLQQNGENRLCILLLQPDPPKLKIR